MQLLHAPVANLVDPMGHLSVRYVQRALAVRVCFYGRGLHGGQVSLRVSPSYRAVCKGCLDFSVVLPRDNIASSCQPPVSSKLLGFPFGPPSTSLTQEKCKVLANNLLIRLTVGCKQDPIRFLVPPAGKRCRAGLRYPTLTLLRAVRMP